MLGAAIIDGEAPALVQSAALSIGVARFNPCFVTNRSAALFARHGAPALGNGASGSFELPDGYACEAAGGGSASDASAYASADGASAMASARRGASPSLQTSVVLHGANVYGAASGDVPGTAVADIRLRGGAAGDELRVHDLPSPIAIELSVGEGVFTRRRGAEEIGRDRASSEEMGARRRLQQSLGLAVLAPRDLSDLPSVWYCPQPPLGPVPTAPPLPPALPPRTPPARPPWAPPSPPFPPPPVRCADDVAYRERGWGCEDWISYGCPDCS